MRKRQERSVGCWISMISYVLSSEFLPRSVCKDCLGRFRVRYCGGSDRWDFPSFTALCAYRYWSSLPIIMLTLVQFVNLDSIAAIYTPCIRANPWLALYFLAFILIVSVAVMNLVRRVYPCYTYVQCFIHEISEKGALAILGSLRRTMQDTA